MSEERDEVSKSVESVITIDLDKLIEHNQSTSLNKETDNLEKLLTYNNNKIEEKTTNAFGSSDNIISKLNLMDLDTIAKNSMIDKLLRFNDKKEKPPTEKKKLTKSSKYLNKKSLSNFQLKDKNDPEMTNDFSIACLKILKKMTKNEGECNKKIAKILTSDNSTTDFSKLTANMKQKIITTTEKFVEKRALKIESIQDKLIKENDKIYTFSPINNKSKTRNLSEFLKDQETHLLKKNDKINKMKYESNRKFNTENDNNDYKMNEVKII